MVDVEQMPEVYMKCMIKSLIRKNNYIDLFYIIVNDPPRPYPTPRENHISVYKIDWLPYPRKWNIDLLEN